LIATPVLVPVHVCSPVASAIFCEILTQLTLISRAPRAYDSTTRRPQRRAQEPARLNRWHLEARRFSRPYIRIVPHLGQAVLDAAIMMRKRQSRMTKLLVLERVGA
jgi:hypothetical protein